MQNNPQDSPSQASTDAPDNIVEFYQHLGDLVPPIGYVEQWNAWIVLGDLPVGEFSELDEYQDEFPYQVTVDRRNGYLRVLNPGTGGGMEEWCVALFREADGRALIGITRTEGSPEKTSSKVSFLHYADDAWLDVTADVLPVIAQGHFFPELKGEAMLARFPLVGIVHQLPQEGTTLRVEAVKNFSYHCQDGQVQIDGLAEAETNFICNAWQCWKYATVELAFDREAVKFVETGRIARN